MTKERTILEFKASIEVEYENKTFRYRRYAKRYVDTFVLNNFRHFMEWKILEHLNFVMTKKQYVALIPKLKDCIKLRNKKEKKLKGENLFTGFKFVPFICDVKHKSGEITKSSTKESHNSGLKKDRHQ